LLITFSFALLVFVALLTALYFALAVFDRRLKGVKREPKARIVNFALLGVCGLMILLIVFQYFWYVTSVLYFLLYPITVSLLLIAIFYASDSKKFHLLTLVVFLHFIVLFLWFPPSGTMLTERTSALVSLDETETWIPGGYLLNSYYSPFPLDLGLLYNFSKITSIAYTNVQSTWVITLFFIVAYDLVLFSFVKDVSGRWKAGVLGILLLMFTPPLALNPQPQWLANLFVLIFIFALFKALKSSPSFSDFILIMLSYVVAILFHGTAAIGASVVIILLILMLCGRRLGINIATTTRHRYFVCLVTVSVYVLTIGGWIVFEKINSVITPLMGLINSILNQGVVDSAFSHYVPLYNQFVSPIGAYAWSVPISLAFAFLLYQLVNHAKGKSLNVAFLLSLSFVGGALTFGGFLGSMLAASSNLQRYLGYTGLSLLIPVAATVCAKILRSSSRIVLSLCLTLIVLFSAIAVFDPAFSPWLYPEMESTTATSSADLIEGNTLYNILSGEEQHIVSTYEILYAISYSGTIPQPMQKAIYPYAHSLKINRLMAENLTSGKEILPNTVYIWTPEILQAANDNLLNVVYNSGRHVAVESSP